MIAPNQTLTLADIPVKQGGVAGSVGQLGQRIGTAIGTAVALSLFYATIYRESGTHDGLVVYHDAYAFGMISVGLFLGLAFIVSVADLTARRNTETRAKIKARAKAKAQRKAAAEAPSAGSAQDGAS